MKISIDLLMFLALLLLMIGSMTSGILLSRHIFKSVNIAGAANLARNVHMICAYWGFVLMAVHAFIRRDIGNYMFLKNHFVFFDFTEPVIFLLLDYLAAAVLFVLLGHYLGKAVRYCGK